MRKDCGNYDKLDAAADYSRYLLGENTDNLIELTYKDKRRIHNLKYFTWIEQQGKSYEEIMDQWYGRDYWTDIQSQIDDIDALIEEFNHDVNLRN